MFKVNNKNTFFSVSIVDFEQINISSVGAFLSSIIQLLQYKIWTNEPLLEAIREPKNTAYSCQHSSSFVLLWHTKNRSSARVAIFVNLYKYLVSLVKHTACNNYWGFPLIGAIYGCFPVGIYLLKVNNRITRTRCEMCSTLTTWSDVSIVNFEQVNADWLICSKNVFLYSMKIYLYATKIKMKIIWHLTKCIYIQ